MHNHTYVLAKERGEAEEEEEEEQTDSSKQDDFLQQNFELPCSSYIII
jgi:hypothetical protein